MSPNVSRPSSIFWIIGLSHEMLSYTREATICMRRGASRRATVACPMDQINCCCDVMGKHQQLWHQAIRRRPRFTFALNASAVRQGRNFGDRHVERGTE